MPYRLGHETAIPPIVVSGVPIPADLARLPHFLPPTLRVFPIAAAEYGLDADDLVLSGSPGVPVNDARDLATGHDHTWVGSTSDDPITAFGDSGWDGTGMPATLGNDPAEDTFGAYRFRKEDAQREYPPRLPSISPHGRYFNRAVESLHNMGAIVSGQYGAVRAAQPRYDPWYAPEQDPQADRDPEQLHHEP